MRFKQLSAPLKVVAIMFCLLLAWIIYMAGFLTLPLTLSAEQMKSVNATKTAIAERWYILLRPGFTATPTVTLPPSVTPSPSKTPTITTTSTITATPSTTPYYFPTSINPTNTGFIPVTGSTTVAPTATIAPTIVLPSPTSIEPTPTSPPPPTITSVPPTPVPPTEPPTVQPTEPPTAEPVPTDESNSGSPHGHPTRRPHP